MTPKSLEPTPEFIDMLDQAIMKNPDDSILMERIRKCDMLARKQGITIYEVVYTMMYRDCIEKDAAKWAAEKSNRQ